MQKVPSQEAPGGYTLYKGVNKPRKRKAWNTDDLSLQRREGNLQESGEGRSQDDNCASDVEGNRCRLEQHDSGSGLRVVIAKSSAVVPVFFF